MTTETTTTTTEVAVVFEKYDTDGSGKINAAELSSLCEELGFPLDEYELAEALEELDSNDNNEVDRDEFIRWWKKETTTANHKLQQILKQAKLENSFDVHRAAWDNDLALLTRFLKESASLATKPDESEFGLKYQPLHYAAYNGHLKVVQYLVENARVNLNARTEDGCTALFLAAQQDRLEIVDYLFNSAKGAAKLNIGAKGFSPLDVCSDPRVRESLQKNCDDVLPGMYFTYVECTCPKFGTALLQWKYELARNPSQMSAVSGYRIRLFKAPTDETGELIKEYFVAGEDTTEFLVTSIAAAEPIACKIAAENRTGVGKFTDLSNAIRVVDCPSMEGVVPKGFADTRTSVCLSWDKAISNGAPVKHYIVSSREEDEEVWEERCNVKGGAKALVDGLNPGSKYYFRIFAVNKAGKSEPSAISEAVRTQGGNAWNSSAKAKSAKHKLKAVLAFKG